MGSCFSQRRKSDAAATYHASPRRSLDFSLSKRLSSTKISSSKVLTKPKREVAPLAHSSSVKKSASRRRSQSDEELMQQHNGSSLLSMQQEAVGNGISVAAATSVSGGNAPSLAEINCRPPTSENITRIPVHGTVNMSRTSSNQVAPDLLHSEKDKPSTGPSPGFAPVRDEEDGSVSSATKSLKLSAISRLPSAESSTQSLQNEAVECLGKHNDSPDSSYTALDTDCMEASIERRSGSEGSVGIGKLEVKPAALSRKPQVKLQEIESSNPEAMLKQFSSLEYFEDSHTNGLFGHKSCRAIAAQYEALATSKNSAAVSACRNSQGIVKSLGVFPTGNDPTNGSRCFSSRRNSGESFADLERITSSEDVHVESSEEQKSIDGGLLNTIGSEKKSAVHGRVEVAGQQNLNYRIESTGQEREISSVESHRGRKHEENRLSSDFFELKNGYLSLSTAIVEKEPREHETKTRLALKTNGSEAEAAESDSETFEFKRLVAELSEENMATEELSRSPGISLVSTGDAVLFSGSSSDEFHLIPSRSYLRENSSTKPKSFRDHPPSPRDVNISSQASIVANPHQDPALREQASFSIDDIILLLENEEVDEEQLLNLLINAKTSRPASDVASESSFEFKVKSAGSTPHSTPSTPMLSAVSTPRRISQLSPLALTPEEIAEIWGVFEQRHILAV